MHSESLNSPATGDYLPDIGSPVSSSAYMTKELRPPSRTVHPDPRGHAPNPTGQYSSSPHSGQSSHPQYRNIRGGENWNEPLPSQPGHHRALPRRTSRASPPLPQLAYQDSSLSSDSVGLSLPPAGPSAMVLPIFDPAKSDRTLPAPVPAVGLRSSPLPATSFSHTNLPPLKSRSNASDSQQGSNWPALLRATDLAREADMRGNNEDDDSTELQDNAPL